MPKVSSTTKRSPSVSVVDNVVRFVQNHREEAVNRLFHDRSPEFKLGWYKTSFSDFWFNLNEDEKTSCVRMASELYRGPKTVTVQRRSGG